MYDSSGEQVDNTWSKLKQGLLSATEKTYGWTKKDIWGKQMWWWNEKVSKDISEKRRFRSCGRQVGAKINIWMQNGKHDMSSTQLR